MSALLTKFFTFLLDWFLTKGIDRLMEWWKEKEKAQERDRINQAAREKLEQDIKEGKPDAEISQSIENLLNTNKP
jgi:hypothetical protein